MIDHDTVSSNGEFIGQLNGTLHTDFSESQMNNYFDWDIANDVLGKLSIKVLIKCIPESDIGAIETVMLKALETDDIERNLISDSSKFINIIAGKQQRYLQKKSRISKAIFNTYFAIRTPEEKYDERAKILNAYNWKENSVLGDSFDFLNLLN
jgi:hypothetical protein